MNFFATPGLLCLCLPCPWDTGRTLFFSGKKKSHIWRGEEEAPSLPEACGPPGAVSRVQPWSVLFSVCQGCGVVVCCSSVAKLCPTLCNPMDCSTAGFPVLHHLLEFAQTHVHRDSDAIQPSHPVSPPFPPAFTLSQHHGLFQ